MSLFKTEELKAANAEIGYLRKQIEALHDGNRTLQQSVEGLKREKETVYNERNRCVAAFARLAALIGWNVTRGVHTALPWEEDWRNILFVDTPRGQLSWHFHDSETYLLKAFPLGTVTWDGHTTDEKYKRLLRVIQALDVVHKAEQPVEKQKV